jgi:DNA-binding XRE family transcriptional regulator
MNLTRKQIAQRVGMSPQSIKRNEVRLGLDRIRVRVNPRMVLYPERRTLQILRARGLEA